MNDRVMNDGVMSTFRLVVVILSIYSLISINSIYTKEGNFLFVQRSTSYPFVIVIAIAI